MGIELCVIVTKPVEVMWENFEYLESNKGLLQELWLWEDLTTPGFKSSDFSRKVELAVSVLQSKELRQDLKKHLDCSMEDVIYVKKFVERLHETCKQYPDGFEIGIY